MLGDTNVLSAARVEVRKNFESNRHLQTGSEEFQKSLAHANEVAKFLRENVVQGEATEGDKYSTGHMVLLVELQFVLMRHRDSDTRAHGARRQRRHQEEQGQEYIRGNKVLLCLNFCSAHNMIPMSSMTPIQCYVQYTSCPPDWDS
jgi:hypothetical protein